MLRKLAKPALLAIMAVLLLASFAACSNSNSENGIYCTVTFDSDGGSIVKEQVVKYGERVKKPGDPTKSGYTFIAWYYEGSEFDFDTKIIYNMTLKARWYDPTNPDDDSDEWTGTDDGELGGGIVGGFGGNSNTPSNPGSTIPTSDYLKIEYTYLTQPVITRQYVVTDYYEEKLPEDGVIEIPTGVYAIKDAVFKNCSKITRVTIQDGVTLIGSSAFENCTKLKEVTIPGSVVFTVEKGGYYGNSPLMTHLEYDVFKGCTSLESVTLGDEMPAICPAMFEGCTVLKSVTIPKSVKIIGNSAFEGCEALASVTIAEGVEIIGESVFSNCTSLKSIKIPGNVKEIWGYAFENCTTLAEIDIEEGVEEILYNAFENCSSLTSIEIPASVNKIGRYAFSSCNLNNVKFDDTTGWQYDNGSGSYKSVEVEVDEDKTLEDKLKEYLRSGYELKHN